jgi:uncharacterized damage-inducible protein DinB
VSTTVETKATQVGRIVEQLRQVQEGGAWHGPSVREALEGVTAAQAASRPLDGAHSIWEIVHHVRGVADAVRAQVVGEAAPDEADWPAVTDMGEKAWRAALDRLASTQRALRDAAAKLPETKLHEAVPGQEHSFWYVLLGVMHHDLYHAGQISLLKKGLSG